MITAVIAGGITTAVLVVIFAVVVIKVQQSAAAVVCRIAEQLLAPASGVGRSPNPLGDTTTVTADRAEVPVETEKDWEHWPDGWGVAVPSEPGEPTEEDLQQLLAKERA